MITIKSINTYGPSHLAMDRVMREIYSLAKVKDPEQKSWKFLKNALLEAAEFLRIATGQISPPIELTEIIKDRKIKKIEYFTNRESPEATLVPTIGGFLLRLPINRSRVRYRSSIAHEIGHTFFYDLTKNPPVRLIKNDLDLPFIKEEDICKAFARELLLPKGLLLNEISHNNETNKIFLINSLAKRFRVSFEIIAVRLLWDLSMFNNSVVIIIDGLNSRRYFGKFVKKTSIKKRTSIIDKVTNLILSKNEIHLLQEFAAENQQTMNIYWKLPNSTQINTSIIIIDFI